jgi:hypothetical protein
MFPFPGYRGSSCICLLTISLQLIVFWSVYIRYRRHLEAVWPCGKEAKVARTKQHAPLPLATGILPGVHSYERVYCGATHEAFEPAAVPVGCSNSGRTCSSFLASGHNVLIPEDSFRLLFRDKKAV